MIHEDLMPNVSYMIHAIKSYQRRLFKKSVPVCDTLLGGNQLFQFQIFPAVERGLGTRGLSIQYMS